MLERNTLGQIIGGNQSATAKLKIKKARLRYWGKRRENPECTKCKVKLTNENWLPSNQKSGHQRCASCERKRAKARTQQLRDYRRKYIVRSADNKYLKGKKRAWTPICELCKKRPRLLGYHHWNDDDLSRGVWICPPCHVKVEAVDNPEFVKKWKNLKANIDEQKKSETTA